MIIWIKDLWSDSGIRIPLLLEVIFTLIGTFCFIMVLING